MLWNVKSNFAQILCYLCSKLTQPIRFYYRGHEIDNGLQLSILLYPISSVVSKGQSRIELALLTSLLSLFLSLSELPAPLLTTAYKNHRGHYSVIKDFNSGLHSQRHQSPQQMKTSLPLPIQSLSIVGPVQFIIKVNSQILISCHPLNIQTLNATRWQSTPARNSFPSSNDGRIVLKALDRLKNMILTALPASSRCR